MKQKPQAYETKASMIDMHPKMESYSLEILRISPSAAIFCMEVSMTETQITRWADVPITNNFMFSKVLSDKTLCRDFLEVMLEIRIDHLEDAETEAVRKADPYSKGVRFDVYVKDSTRVFEIEMQMEDTKELAKRSRYYQSVCDMDMLDSGQFYSDLKESYVIFLCPFDLFGKDRPCYTFENTCLEDGTVRLGDGTRKLFFNFNAYRKELNKTRRGVLHYFAEGRSETPLAEQLNRKLADAKINERWRAEYMTLEMELIAREKAGVEKGRQEGLQQGMQKGLQQGMQCGEHTKALAVARNMKNLNMAADVIVKVTGLSPEEIEKL
jgi:predicted transposase/invertase (TIGR01784 family)